MLSLISLFRKPPRVTLSLPYPFQETTLGRYLYELRCPHCESEYMQQHFSSVFQRLEQQKKGWLVSLKNGLLYALQRYREEEFNNRVGANICYRCEQCGSYSVLQVRHRKGRNELHLSPCELA